jgi:cytoskeleton protein RodZ
MDERVGAERAMPTARTARPPTARLGADLRAARERVGWTLPVVAAHLRIRPPYLDAIEDGRTDELPGPAYAVGFIRTYAQALGLDPDEAARRFRQEAGEQQRPPQLDFPAPVPDRGVPALVVVLIGAVLAVGAYATWYRMSGNDRPSTEVVQQVPDRLVPLAQDHPPSPPSVAPTAHDALATAIPPAASLDPATAPHVPADTASVPPSAAAAATTEPAIRIPAATPAPHLAVRTTGDAWVQVRDGQGRILVNRLMHVGETWAAPDQAGLVLSTGNAGATQVLVNGAGGAPLGADGVVRRGVALDAGVAQAASRADAARQAADQPHIVIPHNE